MRKLIGIATVLIVGLSVSSFAGTVPVKEGWNLAGLVFQKFRTVPMWTK